MCGFPRVIHRFGGLGGVGGEGRERMVLGSPPGREGAVRRWASGHTSVQGAGR
ncbi:hypothetical protein GA0115246_111763 [Streptomyces sp. SolWspMP-sol7th]|nr:hypothetical protein GA0115246_111763 [Streptomyces sp. SolWspMP-sol7th]